jgi:hypothetical protein
VCPVAVQRLQQPHGRTAPQTRRAPCCSAPRALARTAQRRVVQPALNEEHMLQDDAAAISRPNIFRTRNATCCSASRTSTCPAQQVASLEMIPAAQVARRCPGACRPPLPRHCSALQLQEADTTCDMQYTNCQQLLGCAATPSARWSSCSPEAQCSAQSPAWPPPPHAYQRAARTADCLHDAPGTARAGRDTRTYSCWLPMFLCPA